MIRSYERSRQYIWLTKVAEVKEGFDVIKTYSKPERFRLSVSTTKGRPYESRVGLMDNYDRLITAFGHQFDADEGDRVFVDVEPVLDEDGELVLEDGNPIVAPDYVVTHKLIKQRGLVDRYGIKKVVS